MVDSVDDVVDDVVVAFGEKWSDWSAWPPCVGRPRLKEEVDF